jgi:hypothetical protein
LEARPLVPAVVGSAAVSMLSFTRSGRPARRPRRAPRSRARSTARAGEKAVVVEGDAGVEVFHLVGAREEGDGVGLGGHVAVADRGERFVR